MRMRGSRGLLMDSFEQVEAAGGFNGVPITNQFVQVDNAHRSTDILMIREDHEVTFLQRPDL